MLRREVLLLSRDRAVWMALAALLVLSVFSLWNGLIWLQDQREVSRRADAADQGEYSSRKAQVMEWQAAPPPSLDPVLLNLYDPRTPYAVGQAGRVAQLPLSAIAAMCVGQLDFLPLRQTVSIRTRMRTVSDKEGLENPLNLMSGRFDLAFVVIYFLPLLVIAGMYNLVSIEQEQGTLALLRSHAVNLWQVFLRKAWLRGIVIIGGALVVSVGILAFSGGWREPGRLALSAAVAGAYGLFWWSLTLFINSKQRSSAANATILVALWLAFVGVVPSLLQIAVQAARPMPSRLTLLAAIRDHSIDQRRDGKALAESWYAGHPELRPPNAKVNYDTAITGTMTHIEQDRRTLPLEQTFDRQVSAQQDLVSSLRFASPAIVAYEALQDTAGTGIRRYRHFREQVRAFREVWLGWFHPRIFRQTSLTPNDYGAIPLFVYQEEPSANWAPRALSGCLGLIALSLVLLWFARRNISAGFC